MTRLAAPSTPADLGVEAAVWDRRRLLVTLTAVAAAAALTLVGLGYAVYVAVSSTGQDATDATDAPPRQQEDLEAGIVAEALPTGAARRDVIAEAPMLRVPPAAARSGTPASRAAPGIPIPAAGQVGSAGVATGYPPTPEGAVGQLAAITISVLQSMSIEHTNAVHDAWSEPGAVPVAEWELMTSVQAFLGSASRPHANSPLAAVVVTPVGAQVKGVDGPHWTLACVLVDVQARVVTTARIAYGHCARMQWHDGTTDTAGSTGRWVIGAGEAPARAPSTWPGTELAHEAGWRAWVPAEDQ